MVLVGDVFQQRTRHAMSSSFVAAVVGKKDGGYDAPHVFGRRNPGADLMPMVSDCMTAKQLTPVSSVPIQYSPLIMFGAC